MKKVRIFDPALCCSTGICGADVDPAFINNSFAAIAAVTHESNQQNPANRTGANKTCPTRRTCSDSKGGTRRRGAIT